MIREVIPDEQRQLLIVMISRAYVQIKDDPEMASAAQECSDLIKRLSGTDTVLIAERAYASGVDI